MAKQEEFGLVRSPIDRYLTLALCFLCEAHDFADSESDQGLVERTNQAKRILIEELEIRREMRGKDETK